MMSRCDILGSMVPLISSESVHDQIDALLLDGVATTASEAEQMYLDAHLIDIAHLALELDDQTFSQHEAVKLLMAHGGRRWEDSLR